MLPSSCLLQSELPIAHFLSSLKLPGQGCGFPLGMPVPSTMPSTEGQRARSKQINASLNARAQTQWWNTNVKRWWRQGCLSGSTIFFDISWFSAAGSECLLCARPLLNSYLASQRHQMFTILSFAYQEETEAQHCLVKSFRRQEIWLGSIGLCLSV